MVRVVLLGLDGFPLGHVRPEITPTLWRLAGDGAGGGERLTGTCALPATTYPSFASLLTGASPSTHGVWVTHPRPNAPAWAAVQRVTVPTLLDRAHAAGLTARAVLGDHHLAAVLAIPPRVLAWPPDGQPPAGTPLDAHGYATNGAVRPHLLEAAADPSVDLLFAHLNEADTVGHDSGPDSRVTRDVAMATDRLLAELVDAMAPLWDRSVLVITSDHDMERRADRPLITLMPGPLDGLANEMVADAGAAVIRPLAGCTEALVQSVREVDGVRSVEAVPDGYVVAGAEPGRIFAGTPLRPYLGVHGSPSTAWTLAIAAGGSRAVNGLLSSDGRTRPGTAWAPMLAAALGIG